MKLVHPTRCWMKMFDRLAGSLVRIFLAVMYCVSSIYSLEDLQVQIGHELRDSVGFGLAEQTYDQVIVLQVNHK